MLCHKPKSTLKSKAVERGHKRTRRVRDRVCVKFERPRRYRYRYRYQKKKARRGQARDPVLRDPPHAENEPAIAVRGSRLPPPSPLLWYTEMKGGH